MTWPVQLTLFGRPPVPAEAMGACLSALSLFELNSKEEVDQMAHPETASTFVLENTIFPPEPFPFQ